MKSVANGDASSSVLLLKNSGDGPYALISCITAWVREYLSFRHSLLNQVIASHPGFGKVGFAAAASRGNQHRRQAAVVEFQRMVQPGLEDGRRRAIVFRSAEDDDGIGGARHLLSFRFAHFGEK